MLSKIIRGATRWWHHELPGQFYMVKVIGRENPTTICHRSRGKARREAVKLAKVTGLPTYVTQTVEVVMPQQKAPAPEMHIHCFDGKPEDWFNWKADGYPINRFDELEHTAKVYAQMDEVIHA